jgi:hypothetical protein
MVAGRFVLPLDVRDSLARIGVIAVASARASGVSRDFLTLPSPASGRGEIWCVVDAVLDFCRNMNARRVASDRAESLCHTPAASPDPTTRADPYRPPFHH